MWSTISLLLLLVGASSAYSIGNPYADAVAKTFLANMTATIQTRDAGKIANCFADSFRFEGCRAKYDKEKAVELLSNLPSGTTGFSVTFNMSVALSHSSITFAVDVSGLGSNSQVAFIVDYAKGQILRGQMIGCAKSSFHGFVAQDNAQDMVEKFSARMVRSVESKDTAVISGLFQPGFVFKGCKGTYDKTKIVGLLSHLPAGSKFGFSVKSVNDLGSSIKYRVSASGIDKADIVVEFVLNKNDQQLESGNVPACQKNTFHAFIAQDNAQVTVEKFIARIIRSIESKDASIISGLFQPGFVFKGCKGTYDKKKIVGLLSQLPAGTKLSITVKSVKDLGASIKYQVSASGFDRNKIIAEFILNKVDQQLEIGNVPACQKNTFHALIAQDNAQVTVKKFIARIIRSIESKDTAVISGLFQPGFVFKGCKGVYDKKKIVGLLSQLPAGTKFSITVKSVKDLGASIKYQVSASGFDKNEIIAEFVLNKVDQQLESGNVPACQKSTFRAFIAKDTAQDIVEEFVARIIRSIEFGESIISTLFQPGFVFKGCKGVYDKQKIVGLLSQLPARTKFSITVEAVWDLGASIKYAVLASGFDKNEIAAVFILNKNDEQLESGKILFCQKNTFHALIAQDNAQVIVEKFIARIIRSIESKDVSVISGLFQPGFVFKGCKGVYDKTKIVGLLSQLPSGTKFSITVKSVQDLGASIKYQVSASGFDKNEIIAEFILNKNDQQLESGNVPACQKNTFHTLIGFY